MWQEFKVLILTSVGRKRKKDTSSNKDSKDKRKPRRHSCPPNEKENRENSRKKSEKSSTIRSTSSGELIEDNEQLIESEEGNMTENPSPEGDALTDLNHAAARHRIAIRPNNRRGPIRAANGAPCSSDGTPSPMDSPSTEEKSKKSMTRSASMSSLDFIQIQEECTALLKTKSHSFKALPALFLLDDNVKHESNFGSNIIMVRTLPPMKMSIPESVITPANPMITDTENSAPKSPIASVEQQEKFKLSIANWCLANEGLRKSIQSLQQPPPMSLCLSSESLASICSGLQALDSGVADISEDLDDNVVEDCKDCNIEKKDVDENSVEMMDDQETDSAASTSSTHEEDDIEVPEANDNIEDQKSTGEIDNNTTNEDDDKQEVEVQVLEVDEEVIKQILEEEGDDGLMNVNVKERRQCLMQMINTQVIKKVGQKATLSRMAAKNAAVVKMAVKNLNNFNKITENSDIETDHERNNLETASIIAIEASSKVKLMVSKFDNQ